MANILLLDNIDSFTYNLVDQLRKHRHYVIVYRNTVDITIIWNALIRLTDPIIMLSPGPGIPRDAGCMMSLIKKIKGIFPMIGICLGHQAIVEAYGGHIEYAGEVLHGQVSLIRHDGLEMFHNIPQWIPVARYHSLVCSQVPEHFVINSSIDQTIMSIRHIQDRVCGCQFHPESILTPSGDQILQQMICWASFKK